MNIIPHKKSPVPAYVPGKVAARLSGKRFEFDRLPEVVKRRMRTSLKMRVSEHAAKYRMVADGPHAGPWRHDHAPHTVKIMDTYGLPWVREVWFCGVEQSGKTNTMLNCMHWAIDCDPGDIFYNMPTEDSMGKITGTKIKPMLERSARLSRYLTGRKDDITLSRIKFNHGVTVYPSWANSAASMATFAAKHCFGDEIDKGTEQAGREADRVTLIRKRNRLYKGRYKRFFGSTPAQLFIYNGTMGCPQVWVYMLRCPHCDQLIRMSAECLDLEGVTAEMVDAGHPLTWCCPECGVGGQDDQAREQAIRAGRWVAEKGGDLVRPSRVGFHHRAWECLDVPLSEIAVAWLKAKAGSVVDKIAWANGYEAVDYSYEQQDRKEDFILRLRDKSQPRGVVPHDTCDLMVIADTQQVGFHYSVLAFGWGDDMPVAKIDHGFVKSFSNLNDIAAKIYNDAEGNEYRCASGWIDSGGGTNPANPKHSRTVEVYRFCRSNPFWRAVKGRRTLETGWNVRRLDFYPSSAGKKVPIPGGLELYVINVTLFKDELAGKLQIEPDDPGAIRFDADTTSEYAKQMCAEYRDERGFWICPKGRDNHQWDIWVYGLAAADIRGVRNWQRDPVADEVTVYSKGVQI